MKRALYLLLALITSLGSIAFAQAAPPYPGLVCYQNTAETIGQGVLVPIPSATIRICTPGVSQSLCGAPGGGLIGQQLYTDQTGSTPQPNPITADVGGNFYFCTTHTHFAMLIVSSQGNFWTPDLNLVDDWANGGTINGNVVINGYLTDNGNEHVTGNLTVDGTINATVAGTAATTNAFAAVPTNCGAGASIDAYGIDAMGNALCRPLWYQTLGSNGVGQTSRPQLNFSTNFVLTDSASPARTNVNLASTITSNTSGNAATASLAALATALAATPSQCGTNIPATGIQASGTANCLGTHYQLESAVFTTGLPSATASTAWATSTATMTWPTAFFDGNYAVSCSSGPGQGSSAALTGVFLTNFTSTGFLLTIQNGGTGGAGAMTINQLSCIGFHA